MLAYGTNPYQQRPAPPPGKMYTQAQQPAQKPAQQQQAPQQPAQPRAGGFDMSAYKPGAAQPVQQSYGTAYGQQPSSAQPRAVYWGTGPRTEVSGDPRGGYAGMPPQYRPPPAQMEPAQTPWGPSMDPFADQQAIIDRLNQQRANRQVNFNQTWDNPNQGWDNDSYGLDFNIARRDAGLGNGSPSMSPDYGQSFVGNFNQQFGGGIRAWGDPSDPTGPNYDPGAPPRAGGGPGQLPTSTNYHYPGGGWGHAPTPPPPVPRTPTQDELDYYDLSQRVGGKRLPNPFFEPEPLPPQPNAPRGAGKVKDDGFMYALPYRPGQAQPVQPPSQGEPYAPAKPAAGTAVDPKSVPFYESLMAGDTVTRDERGFYKVADSSGRVVAQYTPEGKQNVRVGGGRTGQPMHTSTPEGAAANAKRLRETQARDAERNAAKEREDAQKVARFHQLHKQQMDWANSGADGRRRGVVRNQKTGNFETPWQEEYQSLINWAATEKTSGSAKTKRALDGYLASPATRR